MQELPFLMLLCPAGVVAIYIIFFRVVANRLLDTNSNENGLAGYGFEKSCFRLGFGLHISLRIRRERGKGKGKGKGKIR